MIDILPIGTYVKVTCKSVRYNKKEGTIVSINPLGFKYVEYGVNFSINPVSSVGFLMRGKIDGWFSTKELTVLLERFNLPDAPPTPALRGMVREGAGKVNALLSGTEPRMRWSKGGTQDEPKEEIAKFRWGRK